MMHGYIDGTVFKGATVASEMGQNRDFRKTVNFVVKEGMLYLLSKLVKTSEVLLARTVTKIQYNDKGQSGCELTEIKDQVQVDLWSLNSHIV